jgi:3-methyladenine DNA glycosylase/8-oxoguanine DNA glycosylase
VPTTTRSARGSPSFRTSIPGRDLALHKALATLRGLRTIPTSDDAARFAARWTPHRAVAARILWNSYLANRAA